MTNLKLKLTKTVAQNAAIKAKEYFIWDTELPLFGLRVFPSGRRTFVVQYRVKGLKKERRTTIGVFGTITVEQARSVAKESLAKAGLRQDPFPKFTPLLIFEEAFQKWAGNSHPIHRKTGKPRPLHSFERDCDRIRLHVLPYLGSKALAEITKADIEALRNKIAAPAKPSAKRKGRGNVGTTGGIHTANRTIATCKSFFADAVDNEWIPANPALGITIPASNRRDVYLTQTEIEALINALVRHRADASLGVNVKSLDILELLLRCGCRKNEIQRLLWSEVSFETKSLKLVDSKTGPRTVVLCDASLAILQRRYDGRNKIKTEA